MELSQKSGALLNARHQEYVVAEPADKEQALNALCAELQNYAKQIVYKTSRGRGWKTSGVATSLRDDAAQEAVIKIYRMLDKYDSSKAAFATWAYSIIQNVIFDLMRKTDGVVFVSDLSLDVFYSHSSVTIRRSPWAAMDEESLIQELDEETQEWRYNVLMGRFKNDLTADELDVFTLCLEEQLSVEDAVPIINTVLKEPVSAKWIYNRLFAIKNKMLKAFGPRRCFLLFPHEGTFIKAATKEMAANQTPF